MGSLVGAAVIGGAGEGLQRSATSMRETRMQDDEQAHELQVQRQRDKAARIAATTRSGHEIGLAKEQYRRDIGMADTENKRSLAAADLVNERALKAASLVFEQERGLQATELGSLEFRNWQDNETRVDVALIGAGSKSGGFGSGSGRYSAHGWDLTFTSEPILNEDGTTSVEDKVFAHRANDPNAWELRSGMMIRVGTPEEDIKPIEDPEKRRFVEDTLITKLGDTNVEDDFISDYGYLPVRYMSELTLDDNPDLAAWVAERRGSYPFYSKAVGERLGIEADPWARPGAGAGRGGISVTPGSKGPRPPREVTVPSPGPEEVREHPVRKMIPNPEILNPIQRQVAPAGLIRQGAEAVGGAVETGVGAVGEAGRAVGGAISRGAEAISTLWAPAEYEDVPPEQQ